ncbi:MAG: nuclear transport factor 2 family protein [Acidobacteria bacterium]|nr:nuclear transport factor 2 family protein [Acidobacteriota bacterium]
MSVRGVQDELAIRDLVARLARHADADDVDGYVALFTHDASWEMPGAERRGHDDIRAGAVERRAAGVVGPGTHTRHVVGTVTVDLDGDRARAASTWQFWVDTATAPRPALMGTYDDTFVRTSAGWRLARRVIDIG